MLYNLRQLKKGARVARVKVVTMYRVVRLRNYINIGHDAEQSVAYRLTGELRKAGNTDFDEGSDIPEFELSVKSFHFTLTSKELAGGSYEEMANDFFRRCPSKWFAYVTKDGIVYIMTPTEFRQFLDLFHEMDTSSKGFRVIRGKREPKAMMQWLDSLEYKSGWSF